MEISRTTINTLNDVYRESGYVRHASYFSVSRTLNYFNNNVFGLFLYTDYNNTRISVPLFCRPQVENIIKDNRDNNKGIKESFITLYVNARPEERRTALTIIKLFNRVDFSNRLIKVETNKGEVYYGGYGVIFDKNMTPLFLCTMEGINDGDTFIYDKSVIYVHPSVFTSNGILEKSIIKTLIPVYTQNGITFDIRFTEKKYYPEVIIKDFTKDFFVVPAKPDINEFTADNVNAFLIDNVQDILDSISL